LGMSELSLPKWLSELSIVDSHVHFLDLDNIEYTFKVPPPYDHNWPEELYLKELEDIPVKEMIFTEVNPSDDCIMKEIEWIHSLSLKNPNIKGIIANIPIEKGEQGVSQWLESLKSYSKICGVRRVIQNQPSGFCTSPSFLSGLKEITNRQLVFDICISAGKFPFQMNETLSMVQSFPQCTFVLDHIGKPNISENDHKDWTIYITKLSEFPNTYCKISGIITEAGNDWTLERITPYIRHVLNSFGYSRCMFGSDWFVCNMNGGIKKWLMVLGEILQDSTPEQRKFLFRDTCKRVYGIK